MEIIITKSNIDLGKVAATKGAELIRRAIKDRSKATIVIATGASQSEMLENLIIEDVDWTVVTVFHLDEYIGVPITHSASFRKYLKEHFVDKLPIGEVHYVNGEIDTITECHRLGEIISESPVDVAFIGIGENGHIAFNDPPADFETDEAFIEVELDEACRRQQVNEGCFAAMDDVPGKAISMSVKQILRSKSIICCVPDARKAQAVKNAIESDISVQFPATILKSHTDTWLYLDKDSSSLLTKKNS